MIYLILILAAATLAGFTTAGYYGWRFGDTYARYQSALVELDTADEIAQTHLARAERAEAAIADADRRAVVAERQAADAFRNLEHVLNMPTLDMPTPAPPEPDSADDAGPDDPVTQNRLHEAEHDRFRDFSGRATEPDTDPATELESAAAATGTEGGDQ